MREHAMLHTASECSATEQKCVDAKSFGGSLVENDTGQAIGSETIRDIDRETLQFAGVDERIAESDLEMVAQSPAAAALDRADDRARFRRRGNAGDVFVPDAVTGKEIGGAASGPPTARTTAGRGSRGRRAAIVGRRGVESH